MGGPSTEPGGLSHWVEALVHVIDRINCGVIGRDSQSSILFINARMLQWTGWERADLVCKPMAMLFPIEFQALSPAAAVSSEPMPLSHPDLRELSSRESEILALLVSGNRSGTIAAQLHISPHTVRNHLKSIFRKLGVKNQGELIVLVRSLGEGPGSDFEGG